jgi:putative CRISPR-associated protein (TIGR02619 family)
MNRVVLVTVGTSLKTESVKAGLAPEKYLVEKPRAASAESNLLDRLLIPGDRVDLLHSQTADGEDCAGKLAGWLRSRNVESHKFVIDGLNYNVADFHRGLRSMISTLTRRLREIRRAKEEPVLCALGGFKAEVAYATLVGALFGLPNHYIHQGFDEVLQIPTLPLTWDYAVIDEYADTLSWLDEEPRTWNEARSRLSAMPDHLSKAMTEANDGNVYLSPLGIAYFESYRYRIEAETSTIYLSEEAGREYADMQPSVREMFDRQLAKLRVREIRDARSRTLDRKNGNVLVYPSGHVDERLYWYADDSVTRVVQFARHEDNYYKERVDKSDYAEGKWIPWPNT